MTARPARPAHTLVALALFAAPLAAQPLPVEKLEGMKARAIGPAGMSGRVTAVDGVHANPEVIYAGTASGGLWKSRSGGTAWEPVFDTMNVASIGAVAVDQTTPDIVWVGTGEGNPRNSQTFGNGVYKSLDGGRSWTHLGLEKTRAIHRLLLHPGNPDIAYVAALGAAWGDSPDRGVYKTTDAGKTWNRILFVNNRTGAAELVMDPSNPNKLIAAMWEYRRWPWTFASGGPGSGIHVTVDGGATWRKATEEDGLPAGPIGRAGLAIARSNPDVVYALVESKKNALYRSQDGGRTWKKVSEKNIGDRPFYYAEIHCDPKNENRLYNLHSVVSVSEDGGKTFETLVQWNDIHPDHHAWWVHPEDPDFLIDGNDGGLAISHDRGRTWRFVENLPLAQFYHINVDMETPYNVYGGMQDNGSWRGPSAVWRWGGIRNAYWEEVAFGDGFDVVPDPADPSRGYAMSQGGVLYRYDVKRGETKLIRPTHPAGVPLRFNWNAGIAQDPFEAGTIYYGSQFLHRSTDRGATWSVISPDLTTNDTSKQKQLESGGLTYDVTTAENHTTITAVAPSPLRRGVIWVGTDDGNLQVTEDGGGGWRNVAGNVRGVPDSTWVPHIHPSAHDPAEAFVVFDNHRRNDWTPYVYRTQDYGRSWKRLADERTVWGYALAIVQDPVDRKLLFLGTEFGLWVSVDGGGSWARWKHGFPTVSTMDLAIHPREHDLVIGTFGRAAYLLDDIRPLRALAREGTKILEQPLKVFEPPPAWLAEYHSAPGTRFAGAAEFAGTNRPYGALLTYWYAPDTAAARKRKDTTVVTDTVTIEVLDASGAVIRTLRQKAKRGINRTTWGLERRGVRFSTQEKPAPGAPEPGGSQVLPGTYRVRISAGRDRDSAEVTVRFDPRVQMAEADLRAKDSARVQVERHIERATATADRLRGARKSVERVNELAKENDGAEVKALREKGKAIEDSVKAFFATLYEEREGTQGIREDPAAVNARLGFASYYLGSSWDPPTENERTAVRQAAESLEALVRRVDAYFARAWPDYTAAVEAAKLSLVEPYTPVPGP